MRRPLATLMLVFLLTGTLADVDIGARESPRALGDPDIFFDDVHNRTATWGLSDLSGYETANVTQAKQGAALARDIARYRALPGYTAWSGSSLGEAAMAVNSRSETILVYSEQIATAWYLQIQKYRFDGTRLGNTIEVTKSKYQPLAPAIAVNSWDEYVVAWHSGWYGQDNVHIRVFDYSGNMQVSGLTLYDGVSTDMQYDPAVAFDANDDFFIAWIESNSTAETILARRYSTNGAPLGDRVPIYTGACGSSFPDVAVDARNNYYVAWSANPNSSYDNVRFQRLDVCGEKKGPEIVVAPSGWNQHHPRISTDSSGNVLITWVDRFTGDPFSSYIAAERFDQNGTRLGDLIFVCSATGGQDMPSISVDRKDNFVIAWRENDYSISAQVFDRNGTGLGSELKVTYYQCTFFRVSFDSSGNFTVVCGDGRKALVLPFAVGAYAPKGMIISPDLQVDNLVRWKNLRPDFISDNATACHVRLWYSVDGGAGWKLPDGCSDISDAPVWTGTLRFRAELSTNDSTATPVLRSVILNYTVNDPPYILSVSPANLTDAYRLQSIVLEGSANDPEKDVLEYRWLQVKGPPVSLDDLWTSTPSFVPVALGTYMFRLTVWDGRAESAPAYSNITVVNRPPVVNATADPVGFKKMPCRLHGEVSDPDGDPVSYRWTLLASPPGTTLQDTDTQDPVLLCPQTGNCTVIFSVWDNLDGRANITFNVSFTGHPPAVSLTVDRLSAHPGNEFSFSAENSSDPDGDYIRYRYDFGDGETTEWGMPPVVTRAYSAPGQYRISVEALDIDGLASRPASVNITVLPFNLPPNAGFTVDRGSLSRPFNFFSLASDEDGAVVSEEWDFGDGNRTNGHTVSHFYPSGGEYTVSHTATDDDGASSTCITVISINRPPVIQRFRPLADPVLRVNETLELSVEAEDPDGDLLSVAWYVNGRKIAEALGPDFNFTPDANGTFNITVKVLDGKGGLAGHNWNAIVVAPQKGVADTGGSRLDLLAGGILGVILVAVVAFLAVSRNRRVRRR